MLEAFGRGIRDGNTVGRFHERSGMEKAITVGRKLFRRENLKHNKNFIETAAYIIGHVIVRLPQTFKIVSKERYPTEIKIKLDREGKPKL